MTVAVWVVCLEIGRAYEDYDKKIIGVAMTPDAARKLAEADHRKRFEDELAFVLQRRDAWPAEAKLREEEAARRAGFGQPYIKGWWNTPVEELYPFPIFTPLMWEPDSDERRTLVSEKDHSFVPRWLIEKTSLVCDLTPESFLAPKALAGF